MSDLLTIAIDGPAGAGKSTIAKQLAKHFSIVYVDTGAMYRTVAYYMLDHSIDTTDEKAVISVLDDVRIDIRYIEGSQHIYLNDQDVSQAIRNQEVGENASKVSAHLPVRAKLVAMQQAMGKRTSLVMDGRDIGTHVLTDATLKVYLTADPKVRGQRRYDELISKGLEANLDDIISEIMERDYRDMNREHAPLKQADDAILLDTSAMGIEEVVAKIIKLLA